MLLIAFTSPLHSRLLPCFDNCHSEIVRRRKTPVASRFRAGSRPTRKRDFAKTTCSHDPFRVSTRPSGETQLTIVTLVISLSLPESCTMSKWAWISFFSVFSCGLQLERVWYLLCS